MPVMACSEHDHGHSYAQAPVNQHIAENITDEEKQTLYVFLTISGEYIAVNYTGK